MKYYIFASILFRHNPNTNSTYMWVDRVSEWAYYGASIPDLPGIRQIDSTTFKHPAFVKEQFYEDILCTS